MTAALLLAGSTLFGTLSGWLMALWVHGSEK